MTIILFGFVIGVCYAMFKSYLNKLDTDIEQMKAETAKYEKTLDERIAELSPEWQKTFKHYREKSVSKKLDIDL